MEPPKKKSSEKLINQFNFDEIDHRLSCGWHTEIDGIAKKKKYLNKINYGFREKADKTSKLINKSSADNSDLDRAGKSFEDKKKSK